MPVESVQAGPIRILLLSREGGTARMVEELLHAGWSDVHLVVHPTWDAASAEALLDHPGCCVLLGEFGVRAPRRPDRNDAEFAQGHPAHTRSHDGTARAGFPDAEAALELLEYVRMSAPEAPIILFSAEDDEALAVRAIQSGAQDCLVSTELEASVLRRAITHAIERKRAEAQLVHQALHDQLTGLPNRALFVDRLGVALERSRRSGDLLAVLFLDFDNFKQINDSRGHAAGDKLLVTLGKRLSGLLRPMDTIARFGGDEFTFLFEGLTSEREVVPIADRICQAASVPVDVDGVALTVTASVGIAMVADPSVAAETIIREADAAMYRAKERGRSRYELFDEESRRRAVERIELEAAIRQAVEHGELRVRYQPTLPLHNPGDLTGAEAVVCWQHPSRGLIAAQEFMPLADDIGLVVPIGRFVLEQVLAQLAIWRTRKPAMTISLNLSATQLRDAALAANLTDAIDATAVDPAAVCLEIAEPELAADPGAAASALKSLKATGVRIAIDAFGGASPLAKLRELPIDVLKIDGTLIAGLGASPEDTALVGALVALGHALGLDVVAEGVDTAAQLEQLRELGCDAVQGHAIGHPLTAEQLESLLLARVA